MPSIRAYSQVTSLLPTDAFVLDRIGTGTVYIEDMNISPTFPVVSVTAGGTVTVVGGSFVSVGANAAVTVVLPAASVAVGQQVIVKDSLGVSMTYPITISGSIDAASTFVISTPYGSVTLISDGTKWHIVAST